MDKKEYHRQYYINNKEKYQERSKQKWQELKNNPEKLKEFYKNKCESGKPKKDYHKSRKIKLDLLGGKCVRCGTIEDLEINHKDLKDTEERRKSNNKLRCDPSIKEIKEQAYDLELLCKICHRKWSCAQRKAAIHLLSQLNLEEQIRLTEEFF